MYSLRGLGPTLNANNIASGVNYEDLERRIFGAGNMPPTESAFGISDEALRQEAEALSRGLQSARSRRLGSAPSLPLPQAAPSFQPLQQQDHEARNRRSYSFNDPYQSARAETRSPRAADPWAEPEYGRGGGDYGRGADYGATAASQSRRSAYGRDQLDPEPEHDRDPAGYDDAAPDLVADAAPQFSKRATDYFEPAAGAGYSSAHAGYGSMSGGGGRGVGIGSDRGGDRGRGLESLRDLTNEELRHDQAMSVISDLGGTGRGGVASTLEQSRREDEKLMMLEEIEALRTSLEEDGTPGLDRIPEVTDRDSYDDIFNVLQRLKYRNDSARYTSFTEELVLWGAGLLGEVFDGEKRYGKYQPDLRGWDRDVQIKLRRMRPDTAGFVRTVLKDHKISPLARIALELVPNAFIYANSKKNNGGPLVRRDDVGLAANRLRDL